MRETDWLLLDDPEDALIEEAFDEDDERDYIVSCISERVRDDEFDYR